jgi:hypothetical protein
MLLGPPICHLQKVLLPPLATRARGGAWVLIADPPVAPRHSHVVFNQEVRGRQYDGRGNDWLSKYEYAAANFAETCAWGGWLRAAETFSLDDEDVEIITPANVALHNLHIGVRAVLLTLGPETKGQSSKRVDVPLADTFAS